MLASALALPPAAISAPRDRLASEQQECQGPLVQVNVTAKLNETSLDFWDTHWLQDMHGELACRLQCLLLAGNSHLNMTESRARTWLSVPPPGDQMPGLACLGQTKDGCLRTYDTSNLNIMAASSPIFRNSPVKQAA